MDALAAFEPVWRVTPNGWPRADDGGERDRCLSGHEEHHGDRNHDDDDDEDGCDQGDELQTLLELLAEIALEGLSDDDR